MVAGYYVHAEYGTVGMIRVVVTVKPCCILGSHYGIIKLYSTSKGLSDGIVIVNAYLVTRGCDNLNEEGEGE